jgi:hypothetical protein
MALDWAMRVIEERQAVDPLFILEQLRRDRGGCVQNEVLCSL